MKNSYLSILISIFVAAFFIGCGEKSNSSAEDVAGQMKEAAEETSAETAEQSEEAVKEAEEAAESITK